MKRLKRNVKGRVHRLPTEDKSNIAYNTQYNSLWIADEYTQSEIERGVEKLSYQHLYITTDEEIKEGEPCIDVVPYGNVVVNIAYPKDKRPYKQLKIIATTDSKLMEKSIITETDKSIVHSVMPQIPQSFIEEYCKAGGIDEVLVEYEKHIGSYSSMWFALKLKTDNTIIIHPVEEKMYTEEQRKDIIELIKSAFYNGIAHERGSKMDIDKWIEENF